MSSAVARLALLTGGSRSGKSRLAQALAQHLGGDAVTVFVTLEAGDDELRRRIARHRALRPAAWRTVEAPRALPAALRADDGRVALVDCLSAWVANLMLDAEAAATGEEGAEAAVRIALDELLDALSTRHRPVVVVTNEVGSGVVPVSALGRWYRDALGYANQRLAARADAVGIVTVGLLRPLKGTFPAALGQAGP